MKKLIKLFIGLVCLSCGQEKPEPLDTAFQFTECGAFYKGKPLPFGKPIAEWEKIFGKYTRKRYKNSFIWDNIGIMVDNTEATYDQPYSPSYEVRKYDILYIFFSNLDSPAGKIGKLKFVDRFDIYDAQRAYKKEHNIDEDDDSLFGINDKKEFLNISLVKKFFFYPYTTYAQSVTIDGAEVRAGMSLKELNKNRKSLGLNKFTFRDQNMNMINERGQTKGDKGEYWDDRRTNFCQKQGYYFYNSVQYSDYELEFIRVGYRTREDDENGKFYPFW